MRDPQADVERKLAAMVDELREIYPTVPPEDFIAALKLALIGDYTPIKAEDIAKVLRETP